MPSSSEILATLSLLRRAQSAFSHQPDGPRCIRALILSQAPRVTDERGDIFLRNPTPSEISAIHPVATSFCNQRFCTPFSRPGTCRSCDALLLSQSPRLFEMPCIAQNYIIVTEEWQSCAL